MKKKYSQWATSAVAVMALTQTATAEKHPNIVFILADDMGFGDVSCLNPDAKLATPNIDALAKSSMVFTDAHTSSAVCTPTRYGLLTGRYNWRSELKSGVLQGYSRALIHKDRDTVASLLKRAGYATAMFGKWHLGLNWRLKDGSVVSDLKQPKGIEDKIDFTKPFSGGPCDHGFDYWQGVSASLDFPPYTMLENNRATAIPTVVRPFQGGKDAKNIMMRRGLQAPSFAPENILTRITDKTIDYIGAQSGEKPFFIYLALTAPHTPVCPLDKFKGSSRCGIYGDFIQELDWCVGRVVAALKAKGFLKDTLLIFTADNGASRASFSVEDEKKYGHHPSYIYSGRKGCLREGGHRVPFIVHWPGVVAPGTKCGVPCCLNDFYATCADIVGAKIPPNAGEDSFSLLPLLKNKPGNYKRENLAHHDYGGRFAFRKGKWKLILSKHPNGNALYNLDDDPRESKNLYKAHPEIAKTLKEKLTQVILDGRSTPGPKQANDGPKHWRQLSWIPETSN